MVTHTPEREKDPLTIRARVLAIGLIPSIALLLAGAGVLLTATAPGGAAVLALGVFVLLAVLHQVGLVTKRFAQLRRDVSDLADRAVPGVVRRLLTGERVDVDAEIPWLRGGSDEIGQVALAFNRAERTAIAATLQESETRRGAHNVFLNIAHRTQVIVHRQLATLDQAEQSEDDPDQLELLFQLDHLATRSRRNAENLIILNGGKPGRQWRKPVPLHRIVDGAIAETEHYTRIDTARLPNTLMAGSVVTDLAHLLAELVDNATAFSPPHTRVEVRGNPVPKGVVVKVEDQGLGLDPEHVDQINATLRTPPDFEDMALSGDSRLGMFVVAQLASRHGIKVTLQESPYGGTSAVVLIPSSRTADPLPDGDDTANAPRGAGALTASSGEQSPQPGIAQREIPVPAPSSQPADAPAGAGPQEPEDGSPAAGDGPSNAGEGDPGASSAQEPGPVPDAHPAARDEPPPPSGTPEATPPTDEDKPPLPRRRPRENLAQQLTGSAAAPQNAAANDDRAAASTRLTMTAFQRATREARQSQPTGTPAEAHSSGGDHDEHQHSSH